ncbi:hypothetical protein MCOR27_006792, partial [Pyricularia oryzae]
WITTELAFECGLARDQTFVKVEATSTDIPLPSETPWPKAEHIPCSRSVRVDVHKTIMLASIGGFRPGTYLLLKYRRVKAVVARDPNSDSMEMHPIVCIKIIQNKPSRKMVRNAQDEQ